MLNALKTTVMSQLGANQLAIIAKTISTSQRKLKFKKQPNNFIIKTKHELWKQKQFLQTMCIGKSNKKRKIANRKTSTHCRFSCFPWPQKQKSWPA